MGLTAELPFITALPQENTDFQITGSYTSYGIILLEVKTAPQLPFGEPQLVSYTNL